MCNWILYGGYMKVHKSIIIITLPIVIFSLTLAVLMQFSIISIWHDDFFVNICIGVFASGILLLFTSTSSYLIEKRNYYRTLFLIINEISADLINTIDNTLKNKAEFLYLEHLQVVENVF